MSGVDGMIRAAVDPLREALEALKQLVGKTRQEIGTVRQQAIRAETTVDAKLEAFQHAMGEEVGRVFVECAAPLVRRLDALEQATGRPEAVEALRRELADARWEASHWKAEAARLARQVKEVVEPLVNRPEASP